jgi:hypothetical protein
MGMAQVEVKGTMAIYYVNGVEVCRMSLSSMTSGQIEIPPIVFAAAGSNELKVTVQYQAFDRTEEFMNRAERRGLRNPKKKTHGPQKHWYNQR